jgi:hypothetical protein
VQSCGGYPWFPSVSDAGVMTSFTHDTAPTQYAEADGTHFAYRRFGSPGRPPLVFVQHFMGGLVAQEVTLACPDLVRRTTRSTRKGTGYSW